MDADGQVTPEDDLTISGEMEVLRRVHPDFIKPITGEPDRSVFKNDPGGVGTSVTLWTSPADLRTVIGDQNHVGIVSITVAALRTHGLGIVFTFEDGNPNHCEVFGPRTKGKLGQIRAATRWVRYPTGYPEELKIPLHTKFE